MSADFYHTATPAQIVDRIEAGAIKAYPDNDRQRQIYREARYQLAIEARCELRGVQA